MVTLLYKLWPNLLGRKETVHVAQPCQSFFIVTGSSNLYYFLIVSKMTSHTMKERMIFKKITGEFALQISTLP